MKYERSSIRPNKAVHRFRRGDLLELVSECHSEGAKRLKNLREGPKSKLRPPTPEILRCAQDDNSAFLRQARWVALTLSK